MKQAGIAINLILYAVAALALVTFLTGVYFAIYNKGKAAGKAVVQAEFDAYKAAQADATKVVVKEVEKIVTETEIKYVDRIKIVERKGREIVVKVPVYINQTDDAACELRNGFVRLHDGAARNDPPATPAESDRAPSGVALSEAVSTVVDNYTVCLKWREQVRGWQEFWGRYSTTLKDAVCLAK